MDSVIGQLAVIGHLQSDTCNRTVTQANHFKSCHLNPPKFVTLDNVSAGDISPDVNFEIFDIVLSNSVCNHARDKQIGLPLRGRPILLITRMISNGNRTE